MGKHAARKDSSNPREGLHGDTGTETHLGEPGVEGALVERVELDHLHDVVEARLALVQRVERRRPRARPRRRVHPRVRKDLKRRKGYLHTTHLSTRDRLKAHQLCLIQVSHRFPIG